MLSNWPNEKDEGLLERIVRKHTCLRVILLIGGLWDGHSQEVHDANGAFQCRRRVCRTDFSEQLTKPFEQWLVQGQH